MVNPHIKYAFNQLELCLIGFISDFRKQIQYVIPNIPVFVINTGDFSYYNGKKWVESKQEEIYLKTPRVVIKLDDIQMNQQEDSNMLNKLNYIFEGDFYTCNTRRKAQTLNISLQIVSPNYIMMLNNYEVLSLFTIRNNVFTYEFLGNTMQSAYSITSSSQEIASLDVSSSSRNCVIQMQIELQAHLFVPDIKSIQLYDDNKDFKITYDLNQIGYENQLYDLNIPKATDETNGLSLIKEDNINYDKKANVYDTEKEEIHSLQKHYDLNNPSKTEEPKVELKTDEKTIEYHNGLEFDDIEDNHAFVNALNGTELARKIYKDIK